jgi:hypothetical protein
VVKKRSFLKRRYTARLLLNTETTSDFKTNEPATQETLDRRMAKLAQIDTHQYALVVKAMEALEGKTSRYAARVRATLTLRALDEYKPRELTERERVYCELRVIHGFGHKKAAQAAGYQPQDTIHENLLLIVRPIRDELARLRAEQRVKAGVSREDVLQGLLNATQVAADATELTMAWKEIGKFLGYYEETKIKIEQTVKQDVTHTHRIEGLDLKALSDAELMKIANNPMMLEQLGGAKMQNGQTIEDAEFVEVPRGTKGEDRSV